MKCIKCSLELQKNWNYCPNCGTSMSIISNVDKFVRNVLEKNPNAKVNIRIVRKPDGSVFSQPVQPNTNLKIIEPKSQSFAEGDATKIMIKLPGVKDPRSVFIRRLGNSIEVNAYTEKNRYFKIIETKTPRIMSKAFKDEVLTLILS